MHRFRSKRQERSRPVKVCFLASGGGHFQQICELASIAEEYDHLLVTTKSNRAALADTCPFGNLYHVSEVGLGEWRRHPIRILHVFFRLLYILYREKPNLMVSTGSGIAAPSFLAAKVLRIPTVYIEAYTRATSLSLAGKVCYKLADHFLVQHRELARRIPRAVYAGSLYRYLGGED